MPGTLQLVNVGKQPQRIQTFMVQNTSFMLVNPDITNPIFIGNDPGSQLISVPALGSVTLDASKHDIWVSTNGGNYTVNAYLMPNGSNWVPSPAQVAAQINALGLAKDTTVQTTNTTLGSPAQNATVSGLAGGSSSIASDMLNANKAVTTEISSLIANGVTGGTPGGVPVLRGTVQLGSASAQSLAAGGTVTLLNNVNISKPSFEAVFKLNLPAAVGISPFAILGVGWQDAVTGLQVGFKQYVLTAGNGPTNALTFYLSGPCRGNQIVLTLQNLDGTQILTYSWLFNVISHIYTIDRLLQPSFATTAPIGFTNPGGNPSKGALFLAQPTLAALGTAARLMPCTNAKCKLDIDDGAQANGCAVTLTDPGVLYNGGNAGQSFYRAVAVAGGQTTIELQMPNGPLLVTIINQGSAGAITPSVSITAMEY